MAQLSLYMPDAELEALKLDAEKEGISISAYAREVLENRHDDKRGWVNGWPPGYFENVIGCLDDDTFTIAEDIDNGLDEEVSFDY